MRGDWHSAPLSLVRQNNISLEISQQKPFYILREQQVTGDRTWKHSKILLSPLCSRRLTSESGSPVRVGASLPAHSDTAASPLELSESVERGQVLVFGNIHQTFFHLSEYFYFCFSYSDRFPISNIQNFKEKIY